MVTDLPVFAQLRPINATASPLPLEHTSIAARITGLAASVTVRQRFRNPLTEKTDLEYLFPLPHEAAISAFELRIGERTIRASMQELEQARYQYETARKEGKHAGLLEGRRPNLFALQLANIQPGEFMEAVTTYHERIQFNAGQAEFVFPMGITPKYHTSKNLQEAEKVDAPIAPHLSQVGDVEITVEADTGLQTTDPVSPSHPLIVTRQSTSRFSVRLDGAHLPNKDFSLRWQVPGDAIQFPAWHTTGENGTFLATFLPPMPDPDAAPIPREYVFVLDRSGSMSGEPIRQAVNALRACLRSLNPQDTFAILLFDNQLEWLVPIETVTQAAVEKADQRLDAVNGRGGTEISPALNAALTLPADPERARLVVFLTDGAVSGEAQILAEMRGRIGKTKLFSLGVGPSVNRAFLQQLARIGRGQAEFIGLDEDIEDAILRFQDRIAFPLLTNLALRAENGQIWDVYPAQQLPDLYAGCPLEVVGRFQAGNSQPVSLVAVGERLGKALEMRAILTGTAADAAILSRLWARARVDDLGEQASLGTKPEHEARTEIISLALAHSLLTKYTAFIAIDSDSPATPGESHFITVAHPLPEGLDMGGFSGMYPQATLRIAPAPSAQPHFGAFGLAEGDEADTLKMAKAAMPRSARYESSFAAPEPEIVRSIPTFEPAAILRELARTQKLNGSWNDDVEHTAAALLAFVRNGHTTLDGHFRKQVARAFTWLAQSPAHGFAAFLRALALRELAEAAQTPDHTTAAESALQSLPAPSNAIETAALGCLRRETPTGKPGETANTLDELRMAVATSAKDVKIAPELRANAFARILAAGLVP